jgi:hypothetical protein
MATATVIQWGNLATWIASIGTVSAVVVALVQVYRERKIRSVHESTDRYERRRGQVRLISAWTAPPEPTPDSSTGTLPRTPIYLNNSSTGYPSEPTDHEMLGVRLSQAHKM